MSTSRNMILAGFGGQGVLFAGKLISYAGLLDGLEVSWLPSYGPEMRGGTANCSVCLSDEPIGSPLVVVPNILVALNQPAYDKFESTVAEGGIIIVDSDLVQRISERDGVTTFALPISSLAEKEGLKGLGNVVSVGKVFAETGFCNEEKLFDSVAKCVSAKKMALLEKNKEALRLGMSL